MRKFGRSIPVFHKPAIVGASRTHCRVQGVWAAKAANWQLSPAGRPNPQQTAAFSDQVHSEQTEPDKQMLSEPRKHAADGSLKAAMTAEATNASSSTPPFMPSSDNTPYERLHVTPLDAELLKVVLSSALLPKARNISYHTIETFPDKRYGFLELPAEDAEKLKKKLNGSVLRGVKIRIGIARPSSIPTPLADAAMTKEKPSKKAPEGSVPPPRDQNKKRKRGAEELSGVVLDAGRKIKRGWTTTDDVKEKRSKKDKEKKAKEKEKKKQPKSKYTDHAECLIKTVLPANAAPTAHADPSNSTDKKKKKKSKSREVVIHEFERTTKFPTFLKAVAPVGRSGAPPEFVDGKGWVDEHGEVVEAVKAKPPPSARVLLSGKSQHRDQETVRTEDGTESPSENENAEDTENVEDAEDLESESASSASEASPPSETADSDASQLSSPTKLDPPRPRSSGSAKSLSIRIPPATPNDSNVHPLEALYKRSRQPDEASNAAPSAQGFSFFDDPGESAESDADNAVTEASTVQVPLTPFTRQDLESRGIRSAAPTPDTAHPNRRFTPWEPEIDQDDEEEEEEPEHQDSQNDEQSPSKSVAARRGAADGNPTSDFQKWFWENRGDLNRSWKKRRKVAGKEKRYRENKARMARAI